MCATAATLDVFIASLFAFNPSLLTFSWVWNSFQLWAEGELFPDGQLVRRAPVLAYHVSKQQAAQTACPYLSG